jgi:hypothetical protein
MRAFSFKKKVPLGKAEPLPRHPVNVTVFLKFSGKCKHIYVVLKLNHLFARMSL